MTAMLARYARWLHTGWPAGAVERLPSARADGTTSVPGVVLVGDLTGIPLLKFAADTGARAVQRMLADPAFQRVRVLGRTAPPAGHDAADSAAPALRQPDVARVLDLVIVGGGVAGMAAALEAKRGGLDFAVIEAAEPFSTIANFPRGKPIFTYPTALIPAGALQFTARSAVKEGLLQELREQAVAAGIAPVRGRAQSVRRRNGVLEVALQAADPVDAEDRAPAVEPRGDAAPELSPLRAHRVIVALGRSGDFRRLQVPGEELDKVSNRLHDPSDFAQRDVLVVGGGDSAVEAAIALAEAGARVTLSYRKAELSRPKPENVERLRALTAGPDGPVRLLLSSRVVRIGERQVELVDGAQQPTTVANDFVFTMIGREPPLDFFRRSGLPIVGEWGARTWAGLGAMLVACVFVYHWKTSAGLPIYEWFQQRHWFPFHLQPPLDPRTLGGTLGISMGQPSFYYSLAYCLAVTLFGLRRIRQRRTPYVTAQTWTLIAIQLIPLFLLPYVVLPWVGHNSGLGTRYELVAVEPHLAAEWQERCARAPRGELSWTEMRPPDSRGSASWTEWTRVRYQPAGKGRVELRPAYDGVQQQPLDAKRRALPERAVLDVRSARAVLEFAAPSNRWLDALFPRTEWDPQGREYWRALGLVLAWPLFFWNVFTGQPLWLWLGISLVQTFVLIPLIVWKWGKGAYCGWICSCGALAETLGDAHRHKMPHGRRWNRLNMTGQMILALAMLLLVLRIIGWMTPWDGPVNRVFRGLFEGKHPDGTSLGFPLNLLNYVWSVDLLLAGILGVGLYFHFSGRIWCRFACPLAALMHIYARFSRFRIFADKKKCISCNVCTSVCHQGIDVMAFANKGLPLADVQCVRCSACVQSCPTGVLEFGEVDPRTQRASRRDRLAASPVRTAER